MHKAFGYILLLVIGLVVGVSVGTIVLMPQTPNREEQVKVTIQEISCTFSEHTVLEIKLENNVPERMLKGNFTVLQDGKYWTSEVKWHFTGDGTTEIICDSLNETQNFRVKYVEDYPKETYLDRIIEWDEVTRVDDFTFMKTEELKITGVTFPTSTTAVIACTNTGADTLTVSSATIDDAAATSSDLPMDLAKGASDTITLTGFNWTSGSKYTFALLTSGGNKYTYTTTAVP